jgi:hypothetical protein
MPLTVSGETRDAIYMPRFLSFIARVGDIGCLEKRRVRPVRKMSTLVRSYITELLASFGQVRPPVDPSILMNLYERRDWASMLGWIKNSLNLDLRVGLRIVDTQGQSAPMWIETPRQMPAYGAAEFRRTQVIVNARRDILERKPFACIVAGFAHELSHVVLFSIGHKLQHEEKAVDLTAMILGYQFSVSDAEVTKQEGTILSILMMILLLPLGMIFWRGTSRKTWRLGYLTKAEAQFAIRCLREMLHATR